MIGAAALLLVVLLAAGGMSGPANPTDISVETTSSADPVETTDNEQDQLIDSLHESIADLENRLDAANDEIAALRDSSDISQEVMEQLRLNVEKNANPTALYEQIIDSLAQVGVTCMINPETNSLRFNDSLLFASSSDDLNAANQDFLNEVFPVILSEIEASGQAGRIEQIIFAGYADDGGSLPLNLALSQNRAESVLNHLLEQNMISLASDDEAAIAYACAGMADQRPVMNDGAVNRDLSRRVEIAIIIDNRNINEMVFGND
jgi:outer membrane protein OmpA-like peptidoglycan-associated protein